MDDDGNDEADSEVSRGALAQKDASKIQKQKNNLVYLDRYVKYRKLSYGNVLSKVECKHFNPILIFFNRLF